jgi:2-aminoethylphosphonate-pyruvate transaminase
LSNTGSMSIPRLPLAKDKPLFTPGPLTTSLAVKQAMLRDFGSRDEEFMDSVRQIRQSLLALAGVSVEDGYEAVLMQGSGTFGVEAVVSSTVAPTGKLLVLINGAYGERILEIATIHQIEMAVLRYAQDSMPDPADVATRLAQDAAITDVAVVHCETTTGIFNPVEAIGRVVQEHGKNFIVDSMSAFGAVPLDLKTAGVDYLISSANKCIEGVPGFSFTICRHAALVATEGWARSLSLDLLAQWKGLESNGQFRFTPPTHAIIAFQQALSELSAEGGVAGRGARYRANRECLVRGMRALGFVEYLPAALQGYTITAFLFPEHANFQFQDFYDRLNDKGYVIYPGKVSGADSFRIGNIGHLFESDMNALLAAIQVTLTEMEVEMDLPPNRTVDCVSEPERRA